jgi:hypothetical protein
LYVVADLDYLTDDLMTKVGISMVRKGGRGDT